MRIQTWCKLAALVCLTAVFCNGCWDRKDFNQLAIAQAMAVDYIAGQYQLTVQLLMPDAESDTVSSENIWIIDGKGDSVGDALEELALRAPREIYLDHLDLVLLGEGLLQKDLGQGLEYMMKQSVLRRRASLLAVKGLAGDILQAKAKLAEVDIYYLNNLIRDQKRRVKGGETILNDYYLTTYNGITEGLVIPRVEVEDEKSMRLQGAAVVFDNRLFDWVDQQWLTSYHWITGGQEMLTLPGLGPDGGAVTVELRKKKCRWALLSEQPLQVQARLQAQIDVVEDGLQTEQMTQSELDNFTGQVQAAVEQQVRGQMEEYIRQMQRTGCDTLLLGRWLYARHPELTAGQDWPRLFGQLEIAVQLETKIELHELK